MRLLRESTGMGRTRFAQELGLSARTIEGIEQRGSSPREEVLSAIAIRWPEYVYWLLTGQTNPARGDISPAIEKTRRDSNEAGKAG